MGAHDLTERQPMSLRRRGLLDQSPMCESLRLAHPPGRGAGRPTPARIRILMSRSSAQWFVVFLLLPVGAGAQDSQAQLQTELRLERRMLALDLVTYNEDREKDRRAQQAVSQVLARLDTALAGDSVSLGTLEALQNDLDAARATVRITEERLSVQLRQIQERLRRIGLLGGETGARPAAADPV